MHPQRLALLLAAALAAGCLDNTTPKSDAGASTSHDSGSSGDAGQPDSGTVDAGATGNCPDAAKSCLANPDCAASEVCILDTPGMAARCCVAGTRGTGAVGDSCTADSQCAFGLCLARDDGQKFCSGACPNTTECPGTMNCSALFKMCFPRDTTVPLTSCAQGALNQCFDNSNCQNTERCENKGTILNEVLCCTTGPRGTKTVGQACASELECVFGRCLGSLCSDFCDGTVDPCPPATMVCNTMRAMCEPI